jgi:L-threonine O-3-phosphate decarboxylase (EC 4.1.1.81)
MRRRFGARFSVYPSDAPFLLLDAGTSKAVDEIRETVREQNIAVRDARTFRGLDSHVRVAVRRPAENDLLLEALGV